MILQLNILGNTIFSQNKRFFFKIILNNIVEKHNISAHSTCNGEWLRGAQLLCLGLPLFALSVPQIFLENFINVEIGLQGCISFYCELKVFPYQLSCYTMVRMIGFQQPLFQNQSYLSYRKPRKHKTGTKRIQIFIDIKSFRLSISAFHQRQSHSAALLRRFFESRRLSLNPNEKLATPVDPNQSIYEGHHMNWTSQLPDLPCCAQNYPLVCLKNTE